MFSGGSSNDFDLYKDLQRYYAHSVSILKYANHRKKYLLRQAYGS